MPWNWIAQAGASNPTCAEDVIFSAVPRSEIGGNYGLTQIQGSSATPAVLYQGWMKIYNDDVFDLSCGASDDGCTKPQLVHDIRPLTAHELYHSLGFGHCGLNNGAQCHVAYTSKNVLKEGNVFWTAQRRDRMGLFAVYP